MLLMIRRISNKVPSKDDVPITASLNHLGCLCEDIHFSFNCGTTYSGDIGVQPIPVYVTAKIRPVRSLLNPKA